ncbi:hypothetical protein FBU59_003248 [Linderina macrospora]|uniref:Uncharacterized protein n=1 Tax=Linderina macrospora TaxID=4868 RepID=A0ACC1J8V2_9FUNG|nr:hypothetical protein FBU59_003248 [Linderina macrospora]
MAQQQQPHQGDAQSQVPTAAMMAAAAASGQAPYALMVQQMQRQMSQGPVRAPVLAATAKQMATPIQQHVVDGTTPGASSSAASTATSTPALATAGLPLLTQPATATGGGSGGGSVASPALSTATRKSKGSPRISKKTAAKDTKRKAGAKKDAESKKDSSESMRPPPSAGKRSVPPANKRSRTMPVVPQQLAIDTATVPAGGPMLPPAMPHAVPMSAGILPPQPANEVARTAMPPPPRPGSVQIPLPPSLPRASSRPTVPVVPMAPAPSVPQLSPDQVLGSGIERLLSFHSKLSAATRTNDEAFWQAAISDHFAERANIRLDLGSQTYDMPIETAARFYHQLFTEGNATSIHVALGSARVHLLDRASSIVSFHGVLVTTAYANGRRVVEHGDLRVIFDPSFSLQLWAFSASDSTILLPRKRPSGADDAMTRSADATIMRNLAWPKELPPPRRRKSTHGRLPPEECSLPPCSMQHLEMASIMYMLSDLISVQMQYPNEDNVLQKWSELVNPEPYAAPPTPATKVPLPAQPPAEKKQRVRRKSVPAVAQPIAPAKLQPAAPAPQQQPPPPASSASPSAELHQPGSPVPEAIPVVPIKSKSSVTSTATANSARGSSKKVSLK